MFDPNDFSGSDSRRIAAAVAAAAAGDRTVVISKRRGPDRDHWLIDEAILLPDGIQVTIDDCRIKLSDRARDNFFRTANCGMGISDIQTLRGIRLLGRGRAVLEGADHPRATGDANKTLGVRTYGTDAGKPGEKQTGDWRNIGVLFARTEDFEIAGLLIRNYHCWGVSLEKCAHGRVHDLAFDTREKRLVDGVPQMMLNQDGLDIRKGCHHIEIENISGRTGDDLVALTAIHPEATGVGTLDYTEVSGCPGTLADNDIHDITVRHVHGYSTGGHQIFRILNSRGLKIRNVTVEDVRDESLADPEGVRDNVTVRIGDNVAAWGGISPVGDTRDIVIRQVDSRARKAVLIAGSLADSRIEDVVNRNPDCEPVDCTTGPEYMRNVAVLDARTVPGK